MGDSTDHGQDRLNDGSKDGNRARGRERTWWRTGGLVVALLTVIGAAFVAGHQAGAAPTGPGTEEDPLVARSYVDQFVRLEVVTIRAGQQLEGGTGTEIIVRAGAAKAVGSPAGGLANVTQGRDMQTGENVPLNHLLIVPRDDGRGLRAVSDTVVMIRGPFKIR